MIYEKYRKLAIQKIESILENLNIEYKIAQNSVKIMCPVHGSSSHDKSIIYLDTGVWVCFSGNCHLDNNKDILGLIRWCLSKDKDTEVKWSDVYSFINKQEKLSNITIQKQEDRPLFFDESLKPITRIPSLYFVKKRYYSEEVLTEFEVGDGVEGFLKNKAVVPIRHINNQYMGYSARSHYEKCKSCAYYHNKYETCINETSRFVSLCNKWYHSKGLQKSKTLYGINKIKNTKKIAIVEGPGCVWRLWEHGIPAVSALGKHFDKNRLSMLKNLGVEKIMFASDNDKAGSEFKDRFIKDFHKEVQIFVPNLTEKDKIGRAHV